jgi:hypothetical protein
VYWAATANLTRRLTFSRTCLTAGSHYVDLANELDPVLSVLELAPEAAAAELTFVTGAGFGVLATEALVYELCAGRPPRLGADVERTPLPGGGSIRTVVVPTGELEAARRASGAPDVSAASSEVPTDRISRLALPVMGAAMRFGPARRGLVRLVDRLQLAPPAKPGDFSWAYARVGERQWALTRPVRLRLAGHTVLNLVAAGLAVMGAFVIYLAGTRPDERSPRFLVAIGHPRFCPLLGRVIETGAAQFPETFPAGQVTVRRSRREGVCGPGII